MLGLQSSVVQASKVLNRVAIRSNWEELSGNGQGVAKDHLSRGNNEVFLGGPLAGQGGPIGTGTSNLGLSSELSEQP